MLKLLGFVVVLAIIFTVVGLWRGWIDIDTSSSDPDRSRVEVSLNEKNLERDIDGAKAAVVGESATGMIRSVDASAARIEVAIDDGGVVGFAIEKDASMRLDDVTVGVAALKAGDRVELTWRDDDGRRVVTKLEALRP